MRMLSVLTSGFEIARRMRSVIVSRGWRKPVCTEHDT